MREDPRFTANDVVRLFQKNLTFVDRRLVLAYFWSLDPRTVPSETFIDTVLDLFSAIPGGGTIVEVFKLTAEVTSAILATVDLFKAKDVVILTVRETEDALRELSALKLDFEEVTMERSELRNDLADKNVLIANLRGDIDFLNSINDSLELELFEARDLPIKIVEKEVIREVEVIVEVIREVEVIVEVVREIEIPVFEETLECRALAETVNTTLGEFQQLPTTFSVLLQLLRGLETDSQPLIDTILS